MTPIEMIAGAGAVAVAVAVGALGAGAGWVLERRCDRLPKWGRVAVGAVLFVALGSVAVAWWVEDLQRVGVL